MEANQIMTTQSEQSALVPEFVDTTTPSWQWYSYNLFIFVASILMVLFSIALLEYEIAKYSHPLVSFIQTPTAFDYSVAVVVGLLGLANLSVLLFVFLRHLWSRQWMLATVIIGWMLIATTVLVLGERFIPVIFT